MGYILPLAEKNGDLDIKQTTHQYTPCFLPGITFLA